MRLFVYSLLGALAVIALAGGLCAAQADNAEAVKEKLFQAKKSYDAEVQKFKKAVTDLLDKREDLARIAGDKKSVDLAKAEREAFNSEGHVPATLPAAVKQQLTTAKSTLDKAYTAAVKEYVRLKEDAAAEAVEKEQKEFRTKVVGKLRPVDVTTKEDLQTYLAGTTWMWGDGVKFKPDGNAEQKQWESRGLVTKWEAVDRRTVVFFITKGRDHDLTATLVFAEDLSEFKGFSFNGARLSTKRKQ